VIKAYFFVVATSFLIGLYLSFYSAHLVFLFYVLLLQLFFFPQNKLKALAVLTLVLSFMFGSFYFKKEKSKLPTKAQFFGEVLKVEPYFEGKRVLLRLTSGEEILFTAYKSDFSPGMKCLLSLTSKEMKEGLNPFRPTTKELARAQGVEELYEFRHQDQAICKTDGFNIESIRYELFRFSEELSGLGKGLFQALVLGVETQLPSEYLDALKKQGLYHQLAISGFNLGILYGILYKFTLFWLRRTPLVFTRYPLQIYAMIFSLPGALVVLFLSGFAGSAVRAFFFLFVLVLAKVFFRSTPSLLILLLTAFILCLFEPSLIGNLSFQFSFLATLGLLLANQLWQRLNLKPKNLRQKTLFISLQGLFVSSFISLLLLPILLYRIGYYAIATPINNLLASVFWSFIFIPFSLLSALVYFLDETLAKYLMEFVSIIFKWYMKIPFFDWLYISPFSVNLLLIIFLICPLVYFTNQKIIQKLNFHFSFYVKYLSLFLAFLSFILTYYFYEKFYQKTDFIIVFKDKNFPHILLKNQDKFALLLNLKSEDIKPYKAKYFPIYYKFGVSSFECVVNFSRFNPYRVFSKDFEVRNVSTLEEKKYLDIEVCDPRMFELIELKEGAYFLEFKGFTLALVFHRKPSLPLPAEVSIFSHKLKDKKDLPAESILEGERQSALILIPKEKYALLFSEKERRDSFLAYFLFPFVPYYFEDNIGKIVSYHHESLP
jgi:competence protein ComEC